MKRSAEQWADYLEGRHHGLSTSDEIDLALLLRAMVAEREAWELQESERKLGTIFSLHRATAARRRAEGEE